MDASVEGAERFASLIRLVRLARQMERAGHYNAAKLLWAAAFSEEVRASEEAALEYDRDSVDRDLDAALGDVKAAGGSSEFITALVIARKAVREERQLPFEQAPQVYVCRGCGHIALGDLPARCALCGAFELTFKEFPPVHYLDPLPPSEALQGLTGVAEALHRLVDGLSEEISMKSPGPGEWSIHDVLNHMLGSQELVNYRIQRMLDEDDPPLKAVSIPTADETGSTLDILAAFEASRDALVERLGDMPAEDWWRTGWHEEFGKVTVLQQASYFAKHDHAHLTQIGRLRRTLVVS